MRQGHSNGGRRSLGPRRLVSSRLPEPMYARLCELAKERDISLNDFMVELVARELEADANDQRKYSQGSFFPSARSA